MTTEEILELAKPINQIYKAAFAEGRKSVFTDKELLSLYTLAWHRKTKLKNEGNEGGFKFYDALMEKCSALRAEFNPPSEDEDDDEDTNVEEDEEDEFNDRSDIAYEESWDKKYSSVE